MLHLCRLFGIVILAAGAGCALPIAPLCAEPVHTEVVETKSGWELHRDGEPYFISGAGGDADKALLVEVGGNSIRTWGVGADSQAVLDEAHRHGLTVTFGFWLGHPRHGFDYNDHEQVAEQFEAIRNDVERFKDHPALLMWSIGNEMETHGNGGNAAIWSHVEAIAAMIKRLDPHHPTMTVVAEVGDDKVDAIHRLCPSVDIIGFNSYGGIMTLAERYRAAGGTKPYVVTEFGPLGTWEVGKNEWGVAIEPTSTEKAVHYGAGWEKAVGDERGKLSLGSYVFLWGQKQETTATWFGMLLPGDYRLGAVDSMQLCWTGEPPANRVPEIKSLAVDGPVVRKPGATMRVKLAVRDPEGDKLRVEWLVRGEATDLRFGGDAEAAPPDYPEAVLESDDTSAVVRLPDQPGGYRVFAYVYDDANRAAAVANVPVYASPDGTVKPVNP